MDNQQHYIEQLESMYERLNRALVNLLNHPNREDVKAYTKAFAKEQYLSFEALRMANPTPYAMECSLDILNEDNPKLECY